MELQQEREHLIEKSENHQMKVKNTFDRKTKKGMFKTGDFVLKWDATRQKKGQHGKFDALWTGPYVIAEVCHNNTFVLHHLDGEILAGGPFNGRFLKIYFS